MPAPKNTNEQPAPVEEQTPAASEEQQSETPVQTETPVEEAKECADCATLRTEIEQLRTQVPAEGTRQLSAEEATAFDAFTALSLTAEQLQEKLTRLATLETEHETLRSEAATLRSDSVLRDAVEAMKWELDSARFALKGLDGTLEMRSGAPFVVNGSEAMPLDDWAKAKLPAAVYAALPTEKQEGISYPDQVKGGQPPKSNPLKVLANQYVLPSQRNKS